MNSKVITWLEKHHACDPAVEWAREQKTLTQAWKDCKRGDWMAWLIHRSGANGEPWSEERKPFVLAMCECGRLSLKYVPEGEDRPRKCYEIMEAWVRGEATIEECRQVARAAAEAAEAIDAAAAAGAAWAVAAAEAAWAAEAAREKVLSQCADIIRKYYPRPPRLIVDDQFL